MIGWSLLWGQLQLSNPGDSTGPTAAIFPGFCVKICWPIFKVLIYWVIVYQSLFHSKTNSSCALRRAQNIAMNVCANYEFWISRLIHIQKYQ